MKVEPKITTQTAQLNIKSQINATASQLWKKDDIVDQCKNIIGQLEGLRLKAYICSAGRWTIGYGHVIIVNGKQATRETHTFEQLPYEFQTISLQKADTIFAEDILEFMDFVIKEVGSICNTNQIAALTSFTFNVGKANFKKSTLLKIIKKNAQDFINIRKEFMRWVHADGKILHGLEERRKKEADLFEKP